MNSVFPSDFLWGASISSYQVEGDNILSDWYYWEKQKGLTSSGRACRHYEFFEEDFDLAHRISLSALRFSIEWSRVAPDALSFSEDAVSHYVRQVNELTGRNITPFLTLHHFTNPYWFSQKGGWMNAGNIDFFLAYIIKIVQALKNNARYFIVFNEPMVYLYNGFIEGIWPPGQRSFRDAMKAFKNILSAYILAYKEIKRIMGGADSSVSIAKSMLWFSPCNRFNFGQNSFFSFIRSRFFNYYLLDKLCSINMMDFLGLNYYCKQYVRNGASFAGKECTASHHRDRKNSMGWNVSAKGFERILLSLRRYRLPVIVTENGTAENDPALYEEFLVSHIRALADALKRGVNIKGYMWWSLIDNFEWDKGFSPRFGLVNVDYSTFKRTLKPVALRYKKIIEENAGTF